ncbi:MAG: histidine kinase [Gammaproteobacteria bacterium]|jgi:HD-like signal output (HDOD) protein|nr:histidine kinase [Gammaproteobacteria bacterium]
MPNLAEKIHDELTSAVSNDELELPTLPEVALRIRDEAENPNVSALSLAKVIAEDPGLSGRMIKVANSPMYRGAQTIEDLNMAISRVGVEFASNLATGMAMEQMFQATSDVIDRKLRQIWNHASAVAGISAVLARRFAGLRPDQASLAGLTHVIGVLPILSWAEDNSGMLGDSMTLDRVIDSIHPALGTMILKSWEFPEEIAIVPSQYTNFERTAPAADYADVVMVANLQTLIGSQHPYTQLDWSQIQAFHNLGIDPSPESEALADLAEELAAAQDAFKA